MGWDPISASSADAKTSSMTRCVSAGALAAVHKFEGDIKLRTKFARILDLMAADRGGIEIAVVENAAHMGILKR